MTEYHVFITKKAKKDIQQMSSALRSKIKDILLNRLAHDPFSGKKLVGELKGYYSVRLTYKDRIVYSVDPEKKVINVVRAKTHYGD